MKLGMMASRRFRATGSLFGGGDNSHEIPKWPWRMESGLVSPLQHTFCRTPLTADHGGDAIWY